MSRRTLDYASKREAAASRAREFHRMGLGEIVMFGCWCVFMLLVVLLVVVAALV